MSTSNELAHLQVFKLQDTRCCWLDEPELLFVKNVARNATNLRELHFQLHLEEPDEVEWLETQMDDLSDKSGVLFVCEFSNYGSDDFEPGELLTQDHFSRLAIRQLYDYTFGHIDKDVLDSVLPNSRKTLATADIHVLWLAKMFQHGMRFENLLELTVYINFPYFRRKYPALLHEILRANLWKRCFPNLRKLKVIEPEREPEPELQDCIEEEDHEDAIVETIAGFHSISVEQTIPNSHLLEVRGLNRIEDFWDGVFLTEGELDFACSLCPHVKELKTRGMYSQFPYLWGHLKCLESFHVVLLKEIENIDSTFCGIHQEEAAQLKKNDVKYLNEVHIVPIRPPLTHAAGEVKVG